MSEKMTLSKLAKLCNVSVTTASLIFNRQHKKVRISEDTVNRVIAIARRYEADPLIASLLARVQCSNTVGIIVPDLLNYSFSFYLNEYEAIFRAHDIQILISCSHYNEEQEISVVDSLVERKVDALLVFSSLSSPKLYEKLSSKLPVILIDRYFPNSKLPFVVSEAKNSTFELIDNYLTRNHQPYFLGADIELSAIADRLLGFTHAYHAHNLDPASFIYSAPYQEHIGAQLVERILKDHPKSDHYYLYCSSYIIFVQAFFYIKAQGIDMSRFTFLVFDYVKSLALLDADIVCIKQDYQQICAQSYRLLDRMLDGKELKKSQIFVPPII